MQDFASAFLQGQQIGTQQKQARESHAQQKEENDLRRMILKLQMDQMKVAEAVQGRKLDQERLQFLEGSPASDLPKLPQPTEPIAGVMPEQFQMAPAPVTLRAAGGLPEDKITPQSAEQLGEQAEIKSIRDMLQSQAKSRFEASLKPVPEGAAVQGPDGTYSIPAPKTPDQPRVVSLEQQLLDAMKTGDKALEQMIRSALNARDQKPSGNGEMSAVMQRLVQAKAKGFEANPVVKKVQTMAEGVTFADSLDINTKNPADDQALIYAFAKAMDPESVVREGEYKTVETYSQSWADKFGFDVKRVFSNTPFLTPQARKQMKDTIRAKYVPARKQYDNIRKEFGRQIERITKQPGGDQELIDFAAAFPGIDVGTVKMTAPDGSVKDVPADQVEHFKSLGAKVAQ